MAAARQPASAHGVESPFVDVLMSGVYTPFSLDGADIPPDRSNPACLQYLPTFKEDMAVFSGDPAQDLRSARDWVDEVMGYRRGCLSALDNMVFAGAIRNKLTGKAKQVLGIQRMVSPGTLLCELCNSFPLAEYQVALYQRVVSGAAFNGCTRDDICNRVIHYLGELDGFSMAVASLASAMQTMLPDLWLKVGKHPYHLSMADFVAVLQQIAAELAEHPTVALKPFGAMVKSGGAPAVTSATSSSMPAVTGTAASKQSKKRSALKAKLAAQDKQIAELKEAVNQLTAAPPQGMAPVPRQQAARRAPVVGATQNATAPDAAAPAQSMAGNA
ncbi:hypothetical protein H4R19_001816 [Coemansia spiralis]|nr:hypothetical protein H4R19_001816 [Coemansia spiralis]